MSQQTKFLWLDLETTGLDPKVCRPLEVAMIITGEDFKPIATFDSLIRWEDDLDLDPTLQHWEHHAWRMHKANGLLNDLWGLPFMPDAPGHPKIHDIYSPASVALNIRDFLVSNLGTNQANLAGNSVHFDRSFLHHLPRVEWFLTHRHLDVSAVRLAMKAIGAKDPDPKPETAHRAMADVHASIAELKHWLSFVPGWHNVDAIKEQLSEVDKMAKFITEGKGAP